MRRSAVALTGAVMLTGGAVGCAPPAAVASHPSALPSVAAFSSVAAIPTVAVASSPAVSVASSALASVKPPSSPSSVPAKPTAAPTGPGEDVGDLEQFVQASATTWWATVVGNLSNQLFVVRTVDAGQHWQDVTPTPGGELHVSDAGPGYVLSADTAWLAADAEPTTPQLFRTRDGGQSWQQMGTVPNGCTPQFVDPAHGWCWTAVGAAGSMPVAIYTTENGGATWRLISQTTGDGTPSTAGALPFGCDKTLTFTSRKVGWASSFCNGGQPYLDTSTDGGARWHPVTPVPLPVVEGGAGLSLPVVDGSDVTVASLGGLGPGGGGISTSSDGGRSWENHLLPAPPANHYWNVDLIDSRHWRSTDGDAIMATDDAGAHWSRWTPSVSMHDQFGPLTLDFISSAVGSAREPVANGPLWTTVDGGRTWARVTIVAGPYVVK
jgi:photosystem II stability/assembly factor-like uncharacterized protein